MKLDPNKLMVIAGEASGDLHGGYLIEELLKLNPDIQLIGTGGKRLEALGVKLYHHVKDLAVIGFWEVLKKYGYFKSVFDDILSKLDQEKPATVLLIDYPGFNLRLAAEAKKRGIKVIYYVAPQVWAWKKNRIKKIKQFVDELIVLFPFEVEYFKKEGMPTQFFGNPLLDVAKTSKTRSQLFEEYQLDELKKTISLLPGSRDNEIEKHLQLIIEVAEKIQQKRSDVQFVLPLASTIKIRNIEPHLEKSAAKIHLIQGDTYNLIGYSDIAVVASGISTLETAVLETPMIIFYKISAATYFLGKHILKIKKIGLPNIVSGKNIVPEVINQDANSDSLSKMVIEYLGDSQKYEKMKQDLLNLKKQLGEKGAYRNTAGFISDYLNQLPDQADQ